jgi:hypothetical protein
MFTHSGDTNLVGSELSVPALLSPMIAEPGIEPIMPQVPTLDMLSGKDHRKTVKCQLLNKSSISVSKQGCYPSEDIGYNCNGQIVTLQGMSVTV